MSYFKYLRRQHRETLQGLMEPDYFDSTLAYVTAHNPGARGRERDWAIFLHGVSNGAEAGFDVFYPLTNRMEEVIGKAFSQVEEALAHSDHLELDALEPLLAARNTLAAFTKDSWDRFYLSLQDWASGTVGLKVENLTAKMSEKQELSITLDLAKYLATGQFHPFLVWVISTYARKEDPTLIGFRDRIDNYLSSPPPKGEVAGLIGKVTMAAAVSQYLKWARLEWQDFRTRVQTKAASMPIPDEKLAEWVLHDLMQESGEDDDD
jgi:hypothetical protein